MFAAIQLVIGSIFLTNYMFQNRYGYMGAFDDKVKLLKEHDEPSIILLGGSNVAFGVSSPRLQQRFNRSVINTGLQGALGLDLYLTLAVQHAREGDFVILMPEWAMLAGCFRPRQLPFRELLRESPGALKYIEAYENFDAKYFLDDFALAELAYVLQTGMKFRSEATRQRLFAEAQRRAGMYSRLNFNDQGDFVGHHNKKPEVDIASQHCFIYFKEGVYQQTVERINACAKVLERRGAKLYFAYSPTPEPFYKQYQSDIAKVDEFLRANLDIPVLHKPENSCYPVDHFFDTVYHLNQRGKRKRTGMLIRSIMGNERIAENLSGQPVR